MEKRASASAGFGGAKVLYNFSSRNVKLERGRAKVTEAHAHFVHSNVMKVEFDAEILPSSGQSITWQVRFFVM